MFIFFGRIVIELSFVSIVRPVVFYQFFSKRVLLLKINEKLSGYAIRFIPTCYLKFILFEFC